MRIEEYLDRVCERIRWKPARQPVREELRSHLAERVEEYRAAGDLADAAEERAVAQMGDALETGRQLDRLHRPRYDWVLIGALAGLLTLGLLYMSSLIDIDYIHKNPAWILMTMSGIVACGFFTFLDYRRLFASKLPAIALYFIFLAIVFIVGSLNRFEVPEGSRKPSDLLVSFCTAGMIFSMGLWVWHIKSVKRFLLLLSAILASAITLIAIPSFSIAVTFIVCSWVMLWAVRFKRSWLAVLVVTGTALIIAALILGIYNTIATPFDYQIRRLLESYSDPAGEGYLMDQARKAVSSLNWFGPGNPVAGLDNPIPYADTDYGLAGFMRTHGLAAGLVVIGLAGTVLWRIYRMLLCIKDGFGRTVSLGLCTFITIQIIWYLLINFGIVPNLIQSAIPMFSLNWVQPLVYGSVLGVLIGMYRKKDLYSARTVGASIGSRPNGSVSA